MCFHSPLIKKEGVMSVFIRVNLLIFSIILFEFVWLYAAKAEDQMLDHYHIINNTGCLEEHDIEAIAREV